MIHPKIKIIGETVLKTKTEPVKPGEDLTSLLEEMYKVMEEAHGVGLAANQIGVSKQVFVMKARGTNEAFVNPEITNKESPTTFEEGCLSIPGTSATTNRFNKVKLKYFKPEDLNTPVEETIEGTAAIAVQHEMDHLNGKLYVDQFGPVKRGLVLDKHRKHLRSLNR